MLEDQVAFFLEKYLGNYVRGLNKEALKISVWQGDVELKNMQLKPEALNALKLPVKVKAGFLGSVKLKVPWSRLGQDPVLVYLDRIFLLAEPATEVEGSSEDAVQEARKSRVREMEMKMLDSKQQSDSEVNKTWLGSLINTIIGNLKLSISNIHIRYEDLESNPGHPFAAGVTLEKLSAVTVDENGKETFVTGGELQHIRKLAELQQLAFYLDSDISPWQIDKPWDDLVPSEWAQVFKFGTKDGKPAEQPTRNHTYVLQPVSGNAKYSKRRQNGSSNGSQLQKAKVNLDDVTLCLSKNGYRDILKLADNFAAFNQRLKYAHHRPLVSVKSDPRSWWQYAYGAVSDQIKKASGRLSWEEVMKHTRLRRRYISLYASLLKSDPNRSVGDNKEVEELDRELDIDLILQWRMLAHKFVEQSIESDSKMKKQKAKNSWWPFGGSTQSQKDGDDASNPQFSEEDLERLNQIIGYKEGDDGKSLTQEKGDVLHTLLEVHMNHNASKLVAEVHECLADLSCDNLDCSIKLYPEAKIFDVKLGSYRLSSPNGLLAESATSNDSLVGTFCSKPFDADVDWSLVAKASPVYMTYLKDSIDHIINFFKSNTAVSQTVAMETAAAVQNTIDEVKRTAQQQVNRALKDHSRFSLDLDIAAPKITIPSDFRPDNTHPTKLLLDLGNLVIHSKDDEEWGSPEEMDMYLQFDLVLSDVSAFLVDGEYRWDRSPPSSSPGSSHLGCVSYLPVIDKCAVILKLQQIRMENPSYPSTRFGVRVPSIGLHFSPARYHRLMQVVKIFEGEESEKSDSYRPWTQTDFEGWLSHLSRKGVGNREAVWQRRYICLVGHFLYVLESPESKSYKQYFSLRGKQIHQVPAEFVGNVEHVLAVSDGARPIPKVVEDSNALIVRCESDDSRKFWQSRLQGAIYSASGSAPITSLSETSSDQEESETEPNGSHDLMDSSKMEKLFMTGVLDELKIRFDFNPQSDLSFTKVLLTKENRMFEFRAIGGRVELSIRSDDIFIGTVLKSLEIEDLVSCKSTSKPCYLARSFIGNSDAAPALDSTGRQNSESNGISRSQSEGDDNFYEAEENLMDVDFPTEYFGSQKSLPSEIATLKPPNFNRVAGLLPVDSDQSQSDVQPAEQLDSFVKAQIVIHDHNSPLYDNIDKRVIVTLATLSFFSRRPTVLAIIEFVNAISAEDESCESCSEDSSASDMENDGSKEDVDNHNSTHGESKEDVDNHNSTDIEEPVVKGLLGKGKSRIIFCLTLNMARAQILLMKEDEAKLAILSMDNLLTDIKVFPSSFSIKASLGNLKISDNSLPSNHIYYWACDMRNSGGSSFVELVFTSFNEDDEDYKGYEYSLYGELSEVRVIYLNRFIQEIVSYFMGLVPKTKKSVVKLKDQVTNSEKLFTTSEIEGSPALKLDLSLRKPIILMPRRTDSHDYLKLDVVHITVQNTFQWFNGNKDDMHAVHLEILTVLVEDINLNVGSGSEEGESIIQDVKGLSVVIRRSLRDLLHQIPSTEAAVKVEELKAVLTNKEYQIITDCAQSNISEPPNYIPPLSHDSEASSVDDVEPQVAGDSDAAVDSKAQNSEVWINMKASVVINLVELSLHSGVSRDASLATMQIIGAWLLYKSNTLGDGFLSATLKGVTVIDDREGTREEFRLAVGVPKNIGFNSNTHSVTDDESHHMVNVTSLKKEAAQPTPTMLILDAKLSKSSTCVSLSVQRPQLLVALDFLLAVVEFFVPSVESMMSNEEDESSLNIIADAVIMDHPTYVQPSTEFSLSPQKPLVVDDERFDHFTYDGRGGTLYLQDRQGNNLSTDSPEALVYVGSGKKLQFKNVKIKNGLYLDSCIVLGSNSSYSASEDSKVFLEGEDERDDNRSSGENADCRPSSNATTGRSSETIIEIQAIGPELTFYNTSRDVGESSQISTKLLHAQLDAFTRLVLKGDNIDMSGNALGLTLESNGVRILEPFDTSIKFSRASGKTNMHIAVSDIFINFTFSILRLFLAVEEDIMAFLRRTSKKMTVECSQFDKVGKIENPNSDQVYAFWRPHAPPGYAVLGDYLTPLDKPPRKGVLAVNTSFVRVKRPVSFKKIWPPLASRDSSNSQGVNNHEIVESNFSTTEGDDNCAIWFPIAPKGYVALGCVVSPGGSQPPLSSALCISASLVSPCALRDCIAINSRNEYQSSVPFWRVDNSTGTFLPANPSDMSLIGRPYELRHIIFGFSEANPKASKGPSVQASQSSQDRSNQSATANSGRLCEAGASFRLVWWNQGSNSRKKLSIWRPIVPQGLFYLGDIAVQGYEPPNSCVLLRDTGDEELFKSPLGFQLVGQIKKQRRMDSISFWQPQAPPGYVSLGCVACKANPKQYDFSLLRCIRSDMVTGDQFLEESVWDSSDSKVTSEAFSIWRVGHDLGVFVVRSGFKKPPKRFALKLADTSISSGSDDTVIDAEIRTFSAAIFDDYGGLMVPLCNISLSGIGFSLHGRANHLNSTVNFSLAARSYNDKYEAWEPLIEPFDGFLRYQSDQNAPGTGSQLRITSARDLNMNVSVSNANMIFQAYASWNNLSHVQESLSKDEPVSPAENGGSIIDIHHKRNYHIIPLNKLGQDIFIRATEIRGLQNIIRMPSGNMKPVKVPVSKNMLDSHLKGELCSKIRTMVTFIIAEAQFPRVEGLSSHQYAVAVRLTPNQHLSYETAATQQSARTRGASSDHSSPSVQEIVIWNEIFFFKVDSPDYYTVELVATDMGNGASVGIFSAPLNQMAGNIHDSSYPDDFMNGLTWIDLSTAETMKVTQGDTRKRSHGRLRCAVFLSPKYEVEENKGSFISERKRSGFIQISPTKEGPWTTVRLNYASPAACWRLGNDVVASEVNVKAGNRYVNIRSLVSVRNNTDFVLELCLEPRKSLQRKRQLIDGSRCEDNIQINSNEGSHIEEFFETEKYNPSIGWVSCTLRPSGEGEGPNWEKELPPGCEWVDDWHVDIESANTSDGWVYAPEIESLKWPESYDTLKFVNYARERRWIRNMRRISNDEEKFIKVGRLNPGESVPLPLPGLTQSGSCLFFLRPWNVNNNQSNYSWSSVVDGNASEKCPEICVSALTESEELLYCNQIRESSTSYNNSRKLWFCVTIQATEIAKDIHSDPIHDWNLVIKSPLSITNFLPLAAEFSVLEMQSSGHYFTTSRGILNPGKAVKVYDADIRKPLYFSLLPQNGWLPVHEAVPISLPNRDPSKTITLRSSVSGRTVQIILEQNHDKGLLEKVVRVYAPYWFATARCPPLTYRLLDMSGKKKTRKVFQSKKNEEILQEITEEEIFEGHTIASGLNFKYLGLSVSINQIGKGQFGPVKDLSPLGDMDGSTDVYAYDADGNCMRLFVTTKPCHYQSVPTKVISVRPFMTFTNRVGQPIFVKLNIEDEPKILRSSDSRVSLVHRESTEPDKLQVRLEDTEWSFPVQIVKEDTISLVVKRSDGYRRFLKTEIRGYEEGSRFTVVFRLGSTNGPIRIENRTISKTIRIRQSGFGDDAWIHLEPLSTTNFSWEDPYGERCLDAEVHSRTGTLFCKLDVEKSGLVSAEEGEQRVCCQVVEMNNVKIARFTDEESKLQTPIGTWGNSPIQKMTQDNGTPLELIIELGVVGVSVIDHRPKELSYLYLERLFVSYSTGYDSGKTSRFKLILGNVQIDNQLPLTSLPVLLAPEQATDISHPAFKMTLTISNENIDGLHVYPYLYIRVTESCWRLSVHEPIIWALVDFYDNLQLDRLPKSSGASQVDPEIRVDLIDISEIRLKVSLETAPAQRPHGILGVWSPVLSAVGNAFKIQVHLRKVMHRDRFMRQSSVLPAIGNRIWRDLIHDPLHLFFSVDVLGVTSSTLASLSKGFAELSTDGQFLQLRSKQVWSRRITGVGDGIMQGTEALAQGVAFGVSGVVRKPVQSARENGLLGLAHGLGRALLGFIVQPVSGALDFFSLTVDGIGASCSRCLEVFTNKANLQRIRNPRAIHADGILREYSELEAAGQMILYLAEASRQFGCTEIFKEPSKFAWSDYYEAHFIVLQQRIVLVTNKRVMLLQCLAPDKMDKKPCKILWDVPWEELLALELAKAGFPKPSHLILHLKTFKRGESFVRLIKCSIEEQSEESEPQAVNICLAVRKMWKAYQTDMKSLVLKVPSSQRHVYFAWSEADGRDPRNSQPKAILKSRELSSSSSASDEKRFVKHSINFLKIWNSEQESKERCNLCRKQDVEDGGIFSIWRPICPDGYVSIGDIAHAGSHPPNVSAVYRSVDRLFATPVGYDLVWRNCLDDFTTPLSIWHPRAPIGFVSPGCVAVAGFIEPEPELVYCVAETMAEETRFEEKKIWSAPDSYPWGCHIYQVQSDALHFVALRQPKEESDWKPLRVLDEPHSP